MNCIILLLLLSCCGGWGNGGTCCNAGNNVNCCGRENRRDRGMCGRGPDRRPEECGCAEEKPSCENRDRDCDCERNERERERENCDVSGMVPPPWQEYPGLSRRDNRDDNDCDS